MEYALDRITSLSPIMERIVVLTNSRFKPQFEAWAQDKSWWNIEVMSDNSRSEEEKPGAIGALASLGHKITDDFLVIAGDCVYPGGVENLVKFYHGKNAPVIGIYRASNIDQIRRGSAVILGDDNIILDFVEKPENPETDLVGAVIYAFPRRIRDRLREYSELKLQCDEPGRFIEWLHKKETVYGYQLDDVVWDIGTLKAYEEIDRMFSEAGRPARRRIYETD